GTHGRPSSIRSLHSSCVTYGQSQSKGGETRTSTPGGITIVTSGGLHWHSPSTPFHSHRLPSNFPAPELKVPPVSNAHSSIPSYFEHGAFQQFRSPGGSTSLPMPP